MAAAPEALVELITNAARAAQSAAEAARLMKEASESKSRNNFSEASKVVKCPEFFGYPTADEDQNSWRDFAFSFKAWLVFADSGFEAELAQIEKTSDTVFSMPTNEETLQRAHKLYAILSGLLRHRPLRIHRQVMDRNGYETWRQLCQLYAPRTKSRSISLLQALMSFPAFDKSRTLLEQIQSLERVRDEYQRSTNVSLPDDLMVSTLLRVLPKTIQQHLHLQMTSTTDYAAVRAMVLNYEIASSSFSTGRIHAELGVVTSYSTTIGSGPMEIDRISENYKGKSKGKYGKGKDAKGKGKQSPYKGKGKSVSKGMKGKGKDFNKGKGKSGAVSSDTCRYCGKVGHWEKDCRKLKRDQGEQVRQVGATAPPNASPSNSSVSRSATSFSTGSETSTMQTSSQHGSLPGSNVRRVAYSTPFIEEVNEDEDLTVFHDGCMDFHNVCMISVKQSDKPNQPYNCVCFCSQKPTPVPHFDMSYSDLDSAWTFPYEEDYRRLESSWTVSCEEECKPLEAAWTFSHENQCEQLQTCSHVRALSFEQMEIVLDSGADVSALPLRYGAIGKSCTQPRDGAFVDAQGGKLNVRDVRVGKVQLGSVSFRERFIIADVTTPLLALGSIVRAGWSLHADGTKQYLCKGDKTVEVLFKRNSLCAMGTISQISETDGDAVSPIASPRNNTACGDTEFLLPQQALNSPIEGQLNAITLRRPLMSLGPGWNMLSPQLYAISTFEPRHINTTLIPSRELMWLRTTLVKRDTGWELDEFARPIADISDLTAPLPHAHSVLEVITLAHVFAVPPEALGFDMPVEPSRAIDALSPPLQMYRESPAEGHGTVVEVPMEMEVPAAANAEPPEIDRDLQFVAENEVVVIDGVRYNMDNSLKHLREACDSLGLSRSGSKRVCFKRLVEHIRHQELIASQSATAKVGSESQRFPIEQKKPDEPSQAAIDAHNLVHEPYAEWCPHCIAHRARQDVHSRRSEQGLRSDHSVVSWDFGFCSRTSDDTDDKLTALYLHDSFTGLLGVVPTPQKGGKYLSHLTTEVTRFIVQTGHSVVGLRCDAEPSTLTLLSSVRKTCQALGIGTHAEPTPVGDHQANGGAEVTVRLLRSHAAILVSQVEQACGCVEPVVPGNHPFFAWALLHSAWTHNRFKVTSGMTAYEICSGRTYNGRLAMFGERFMHTSSLIKRPNRLGRKVYGLGRLCKVIATLSQRLQAF